MKNFTFLAFISFFLFFGKASLAQKQPQSQPAQELKKEGQLQQLQRCLTMEAIEERLKNDPEFRANYEKGLQDFERSKQGISSRTAESARTAALTAPVTIPVVVHIVLPNPGIVTDADVQYFLDRLNRDFSGLNPDSTNAVPFYGVRGHSLLRFAMARRDPNGNVTNGIERRVGNVTISATTTYQAIKHTSAGGLDPWNVTQYYNLWVGIGDAGLLGIAPAIGVGTQTETTTSAVGIDGVCVDYTAFSNNPCYTIPQFNTGRTAVHEVGHNFGLFHIFQGGCNNQDFQQLTTPSQQLPDALLAPSDDTPGQSGATSGCPSGTVATGCAAFPNPPGKMYQNYMDYTNDACYSMFTNGQVERMHYLLENFRPGYLTTQGHIPPAGAITLDASPFESVNPGGYELSGCNVVNYPSTLPCAGTFAPKFRVRNNGLTVLTSITVGYRLNNGAPVTSGPISVNLPVGATTVVTLPPANLSNTGAYQFKFFTSQPNGSADQVPANDTLTTTVTVAAPISLPVIQTFEATAFPPAPWTIFNPNGNVTWQRGTPGRNSAGAMFFNNYAFNVPNQIDDFTSPAFSTVGATDSLLITFDLAHKAFSASATSGSLDTLIVLISTDCGTTFKQVYKKWGAVGPNALATAGTSGSAYTAPIANDWRTERIAIGGTDLTAGQMIVTFRNVNRFGNNIWIDNINIETKADRDLKVESIPSPTTNLCTPNVTPQIIVRNTGTVDVTSFRAGYRIGSTVTALTTFTQTIAPGAAATVTLPAGTAPVGNNTITAYVANVAFAVGTGDQHLYNDTLAKAFVVNILNSSITEGFEGTPAGWTVSNPNGGNVTWLIAPVGKSSARSAFIDNFNNNTVGQIDDLRSPYLNTTNADSLFLTFDLAHKNYPGSFDVLTVLVSTDCGNTFAPTPYVKSGPTLATAGESTADYTNPIESDWRNERVAIGGSFLSSGSVQIAFRNTNDFGNNIFIDNINIIRLEKRDLQLISVNQPASVICAPSLTPSATIRNVGNETVTGFRVSYTIDNGAVQTTTVTGVSLPRNAETTVNLPAATVALGAHRIRVYSWDPVTSSGTGDLNTRNDTLFKDFSLVGTVQAPLTEGFEGTTFPPVNWALVNPDLSSTWQKASTGRRSTGSAYVNNFNYSSFGQRDELATPVVTYSGVDSVRLKFDLSAVTYNYPGSAEVPLDTLEVLVTTNCGNTYTSVYKKWGADLQTVGDRNFPQTEEFTPGSDSYWRTDSVDLTAYANQPNLQVIFRNTTNFENNIYIDNVLLSTRTLPAKLKQQGYLVLPTVTTGSFAIWHYQQPTTLRYVTIYNSGGQLIHKKAYNGNADRYFTVDLSSQPAGTYFVNLGYADEYRNVTERVIKR